MQSGPIESFKVVLFYFVFEFIFLVQEYPQGYFYCSFNRFLRAYMASRKSLFKGFDACGAPANHSAKGLEFPRMAKVISQMV